MNRRMYIFLSYIFFLNADLEILNQTTRFTQFLSPFICITAHAYDDDDDDDILGSLFSVILLANAKSVYAKDTEFNILYIPNRIYRNRTC